jgi:hypothetical protein
MEHVDWICTDNIIIANSSRDFSFIKMTNDIQKNKIEKVRLLRRKVSKSIFKYYFRYLVKSDIVWFSMTNDDYRNGTYYTHIYKLDDNEINELNSLYKIYNREDWLNQLLK